MKFILTGDWHVHNFQQYAKRLFVVWDDKLNRYVEDEDGDEMNSRLKDILDSICDMRDYAYDNGIRNVLFCGDMFHNRASLDVTALNALFTVLKTFPDYGVDLTAIAGNHDDVDNSDVPETSLRVFGEFITVIETPTIVIPYADDDSPDYRFPIVAVPYSKSKEQTVNAVKRLMERLYKDAHNVDWYTNPILIAHAGIDGGKVGSGMFSMRDIYSLGDFMPDDFSFLAFGHYHQPQFLESNAVYCGSICQNDFGDELPDSNNGFFVLDTDTWKAEFVESNSPRFITIRSEDDLKKYDEETLKKSHVRIIAAQKDADTILASADFGDGETRLEVSKAYEANARTQVSIQQTAADAFMTYAKERNADEATIKLGLSILSKAQKTA